MVSLACLFFCLFVLLLVCSFACLFFCLFVLFADLFCCLFVLLLSRMDMNRVSLIITWWLAGQLCLPATFADDQVFQHAVSLYAQKNYAAAGKEFVQICQRNPKNVTALYYCANCNLALGQQSEAIRLYQIIISDYSTSNEAAASRNALQAMRIDLGETSGSAHGQAPGNASLGKASGDTNIGQASRNASLGKASGNTNIGQASSNASLGKASGNANFGQRSAQASANVNQKKAETKSTPLSTHEKQQVISNIIKVVRAQKDRPEVSKTLISDVQAALERYPEPLLLLIYKNGCHVRLTPTMVDNDPELEQTQPTGYEEGSTFRNCPGMFNGTDIVLPEYTYDGDSNQLRENFGAVGTLRHELGHALDWYMGNISGRDDFKHQYYLDLGTIDDDTKAKLAYFVQKDRTGPAETFAELMCFKYGGRTREPDRCDMVHSSFKLTSAYIDRLMSNLPQ